MDTTTEEQQVIPETIETPEDEPWRTIKEVSQATGISESSIRKWIKRELITQVRRVETKFGEQIEIRQSEAEAVAATRTRRSRPKSPEAEADEEIEDTDETPTTGALVRVPARLLEQMTATVAQLHEAGHRLGKAEAIAQFQAEKASDLENRLTVAKTEIASEREARQAAQAKIAELEGRLGRATQLTDEELAAALDARETPDSEAPRKGWWSRLISQ